MRDSQYNNLKAMTPGFDRKTAFSPIVPSGRIQLGGDARVRVQDGVYVKLMSTVEARLNTDKVGVNRLGRVCKVMLQHVQ